MIDMTRLLTAIAPICRLGISPLAAGLALCLGANAPAAAQGVAMDGQDIVTARFLEGWRLADGRHMAAVELTLADGWKTYWRSPGEGGIPPRLLLRADGAVQGGAMHFPRPVVIDSAGLRAIGYEDRVVLPIELDLPQGTDMADFSGILQIGVCKEICVPVTLDLAGDLLPITTQDPAIAQALDNRPMQGASVGLGRAHCAVAPIADGLQITIHVDVPSMGADETMVLELPLPDIWMSDPIVTREGNRLEARADLVPPQGLPFALDRNALRITLIGSDRAYEMTGCTAMP